MILFVILTIQNRDLVALSKALQGIDLSKKSIAFYVVPIVLGAVYYALRLRRLFFKGPIQVIQKNIRERLVSAVENDPRIAGHAQHLKEDTKLLEVFYRFVDSDPSLTEKSNNVRMNGLVLSSFADACVVSLGAILLYAVLLVFRFSFYYVLLLLLSASVFVLSRFLFVPNTTRIHLDYSNSQVNFITTNLNDQLRDALEKLIEINEANSSA